MFESPASRSVAIVLVAGLFASLPHAAWAQVYKCTQPDGSTSFQGTPCPSSARPPVAPKAGTVTPRVSAATDASDDPYAKDGGRWTIPAAPPLPRSPSESVAPQRPAAQALARGNADPRSAENERIRAENQRIEAENRRTEALNRQTRCNAARQQLGVLKGGHAVYRTDNNGERHYVDDDKRQGEIDAAQQRVNADCN